MVNENLAEDAKATMQAINAEFDKLNSELWMRNQRGNNMINFNNLDNLDNKRVSIMQGQNRQTSNVNDLSVQEVFK